MKHQFVLISRPSSLAMWLTLASFCDAIFETINTPRKRFEINNNKKQPTSYLFVMSVRVSGWF